MSQMILKTQVLKRALRAALDEGRVVYIKHATDLIKERGITRPDVERVLRSGTHNEGKSGYQNNQWRYHLAGKTVDGDAIEVTVEVQDQVIVVTVMGEES